MKTLFLKLALFVLVVLAIINLLYRAIPVPDLANDEFHAKRYYFEQRFAPYNTAFVGSSITQFNVNPEAFDVMALDKKIVSYNFGYSGCVPPESYGLATELIENSNANGLKYLFVELSDVSYSQETLQLPRFVYRQSPGKFLTASKMIMGTHHSAMTKFNGVFRHFEGLVSRAFGLNLFEVTVSSAAKNAKVKKQDRLARIVGQKNFGFVEVNKEDMMGDSTWEGLIESFSQDTFFLFTQWMAVKKHKSGKQVFPINGAHLAVVQHLIDMGKKHNVHVIFVLYPQFNFLPESGLLSTFDAIDPAHKIDITNKAEFSFLYKTKYYIDDRHYNVEGATLFGKELARKFLMLDESGKVSP